MFIKQAAAAFVRSYYIAAAFFGGRIHHLHVYTHFASVSDAMVILHFVTRAWIKAKLVYSNTVLL